MAVDDIPPDERPTLTQTPLPDVAETRDALDAEVDTLVFAGECFGRVEAHPLPNMLYVNKGVRDQLGVEVGGSVDIDGVAFKVQSARPMQHVDGARLVPAIVRESQYDAVAAYFAANGVDAELRCGTFQVAAKEAKLPEPDDLHLSREMRKRLKVVIGTLIGLADGSVLTVREGRTVERGAKEVAPLVCHPEREAAVRSYLRAVLNDEQAAAVAATME